MDCHISIVIPVYNMERYLRQCLDSCLAQTMREIRIICVDDGSTDNSRVILQEYADRDSRIEIIDKPNGGTSSARNAAYAHIRGKYTLFVDSDDWIEQDLCEKTYQKSEATDAPITVFFYQRWKERTIRSITPDDKTTVEEKLPLLDSPTACNKLWRTDFLLGNKLYFPEGLILEDNLVHWQAVTLANKISVVPERLYHHRRNPGSITQTKGKRAIHVVPIFNKILEYLLESGYYAAYRDKFISKKLTAWYCDYRYLPASLKPEYVAMIRDSLTADDREFYRDPKKPCKTVARLFYAMIEGGRAEALKFQIVFTMERIMRMPGLLCKQWIVKPMRKWLEEP
ncbi:MAG: glycosyltransferase [Planctomycetaceae bacterium]|nr:glycosyltransferase [Planctomycetaceae bacterium]